MNDIGWVQKMDFLPQIALNVTANRCSRKKFNAMDPHFEFDQYHSGYVCDFFANQRNFLGLGKSKLEKIIFLETLQWALLKIQKFISMTSWYSFESVESVPEQEREYLSGVKRYNFKRTYSRSDESLWTSSKITRDDQKDFLLKLFVGATFSDGDF